MTRSEHLDWCKRRALEYVDRGELTSAVASMMSDLKKYEETKDINILGTIGLFSAASGDAEEVRRFINGFN